jgi:predicted DCC family thiol-disulfide oxidoreductase YuxK
MPTPRALFSDAVGPTITTILCFTLAQYNRRMEKKIHLYYDGECHMCQVTMDSLQKSSQGTSFAPIDVTKGDVPPGVDMAGALHSMHAIDEGGRVYVGGDAILRILEEYPRWRWLAKVGKVPGIRHIVAFVYRIVATHRRRFNSIVK